MFNIEFLHVIREFEYKKIVKRFSTGVRILEIGGGTGYQAKRLTEDGFVVDSIDISDSNYSGQLEFPVQPYDGRNIPFPDESFDIVFSSNVLEHVLDLPYLQAEIKRVLKPGGHCVHLMPTGAWRFWTSVVHYTELFQRLFGLASRLIPKGLSKHALSESINVLRLMADSVFRNPCQGSMRKHQRRLQIIMMTMEKDKDILTEIGLKSRTYAEAYLLPESMARQLLSRCGLCAE